MFLQKEVDYMSNKELLLAMSDLMDQKLKPIKDTLDEHSEILKEHSEDIKGIKATLKEHSEDIRSIKTTLKEHSEDIRGIKATLKEHSDILMMHSDGIQSIKLLLENDFQPRLQNIEGCYLTTFSRYRDGADRMEQLETDVDSLKQVVEEHSRQFQKIM